MLTESLRNALSFGLPLLVAASVGCGSTSTGTGTGGSSASSSGSKGTGGGSASSSSSAGTGGGAAHDYAALVRGTLASANDLAKAKATHDMIVGGSEASAKAAGDVGHDALLGTTLLDSKQNEFLAIDQWGDATAMQKFYADPKVQQAFGALFAGAPTIEFFVHVPDWVNWGDLKSGDSSNPYFFHLALGQLAQADVASNQKAHDMVAAGGKAPAMGAGNLAHVVYLGIADSTQFVAVDIWGKPDNIQAFYTNPQFKAAFDPLFKTVTQPVYQSTDWAQW